MNKDKAGGLMALLKGKWWLVLLFLAGIALLVLGGIGGKAGETEKKADTAFAEAYRKSICEDIRALCERVKGVSEVSVLLTLEGTESAEYAANRRADGETVASFGGEALLTGYAMPRITGVAVVCRGGDDPEVQENLTALIRAALGVSASRVKVCGTGT